MSRTRALAEEDELEVVIRYKLGQSTWQLAERFGVGRATIGRILDRHGVDHRRVRGGARGAHEVEAAQR